MSSKHVTKALRTPQTLTLSHPQKKKYICVRINDMVYTQQTNTNANVCTNGRFVNQIAPLRIQ